MDSIAACHFITHQKTKDLLNKLQKLGSVHIAERLKNQLYIDSRSKACNEQIFYNIDNINRAICENKKISFNYCHYDIDRQLNPRLQDGMAKTYTVSPIFMILKDECYYLISISDKYDNPTHYRIDRMQMVSVLEDNDRRSISEIDEFKSGVDAAVYAKKCFKMYSGIECKVRIKLKNDLLNKVIDELGEDVKLTNDEEGYFTASFQAKYSVGLKRWIMQFGSSAKVLEPEYLISDIKEEVERLKNIYG
jgi:predicted DNA-binding transcriptional regulator YafY